MEYREFIEAKAICDHPTGLAEVPELNAMMFDFQRDIVSWALKRGRAAIWADCGLGKTLMQLEWARHIPGKVLILAPLAVAHQTIREGEKFGITNLEYMTAQIESDNNPVTNYERLGGFDFSDYTGVVIDESSILKNFTGKIRNQIIDCCQDVPYRLACTATPAPNDHMELGNHAEFVGAMTRTEMLSMFFVHDGGETQKWRLKGHAQNEFWKWVCSWAVMIRKPSDLGYDDNGFILPELRMHHHTVETEATGDFLFQMEAKTLQERNAARKNTIQDRCKDAAAIANATEDPVLIWCNLNDEADSVQKLITGSVNVHGSMTDDAKSRALVGFSAGEYRVLITKPKIGGFGMNWQHCSTVVFLGLNDSWESYYQAVRRCYRFGQDNPVDVHIVTADIEGEVVRNIQRKELDAERMALGMVEHMRDINRKEIRGMETTKSDYKTAESTGDGYTAMLGDCVERVREIEDGTMHYSIFSPPFASLYTYSNSDRDMGNCKTHDEFYEHFLYLVKELYRVIMEGRLVSIHCMNLPTSKARDGVIGIRDFRGEIIRMFEDAGFIYHSEVCIWKNPVTAMQRTKALGLLHKQICKDSAMSRQGIPDYLVTMRKPGDNPERCEGGFEYFCGDESTFENTGNLSIDVWQRYASPVWMDINPSNTLQYRSARDHNDERHICPLQLDVIERGIQLWTNPGDTVLSPFMGIGSEGHVALKMGRKFVGVELKESYYNQASKNLAHAASMATQDMLLDMGVEND
jgi:superfamily II DNA or RNA helicase